MSADSAMILLVGLPAPCPADVSILISAGFVAALRGLQRRGELERVPRHDPVVVVAGQQQGGRIGLALA